MTTFNLRSLAFLLALTGSGSSAWAGGTLVVSEQISLPVTANQAWQVIKDFDGLQNWHPYIATSVVTGGEPNVEGAVRTLTTKDGAKVIEELLAYSNERMSYRYRMNDAPLPVSDFASTIQVSKADKGATIVWTSEFKAKEGVKDDEARKMVAGFHQAGLDSLKATLK